ncbi:MAG: sugar ABC transporter ATP-binding protein [Ruminococcaceae bacterium]|nr:sugar ABC transporter ATP-binding protein [Oscillospiraceae bacterium]
MSEGILLRMENISKSFPGVRALDGARLHVKAGTVHALMGENGAGKSTLMKCLFGVYTHEEGEIFLNGEPISPRSSKEALSLGIAMVHQELNQALKLTVAENMWLGRFPRPIDALPFISKRQMIEKTGEIFDALGIDIDPEALTERLSVSDRQMVEIARAVSYGARIIVFDEPTSSLGEEEAERLFGIIERLRSDGCGIIYISHKMNEILRISDEVTVMRDGRHIATRSASDITTDEIIRLMVGRELSERYPARATPPKDDILLSVTGLSGEYSHLNDVSFSLRKGEILGIAGLDGSGRTELLEALFGLSRRSGGEIRLSGKNIYNRTPGEAIRNGFAMVTEERRAGGIFGILDIKENTVISSLKGFRRGPLISEKLMRSSTTEYMKRLKVRAPDMHTKIRSLSGGNQQKVIFARWLLTSPTVLLLDEPTRGIDVGARYEIYALINELAESGRGVILVSSEMPELLGLCDRIMVMSNGRAAGTVDRGASQESIITLATKYI